MSVSLKAAVKKYLSKAADLFLERLELQEKNGPQVKINQRMLFNFYKYSLRRDDRFPLSDTGFRVYSQFEEDGILLYIFAAIGDVYRTFIDIGSGNGINSNCANFAINFGWNGLFIDGNPANIERGRKYYSSNPDTALYPPTFVNAFIQRENINELIVDHTSSTGQVDLMSIDIDGNDYWIWDAITAVEPRVVIIETNIEFGMNSIVVPYDKDYMYPGKHPNYFGASPAAMEKLARRKGYRLVGANNYGFNTIYIKNGIGEDVIPAVSVETILQHPRNREQQKLFVAIKDWEYIHV
ncbi:MAG: hypothetical protein ACYC7J_16165 [Syntrophales bacterium]